MVKRLTELDTLLDLHGEVLVQEGGYWIKIEAWTVEPSEGIPHGIRYSPPKKGFAGRRLEYDHVHRHAKDKGVAYEFSTAGQLLVHFFEEVDKVLKELL